MTSDQVLVEGQGAASVALDEVQSLPESVPERGGERGLWELASRIDQLSAALVQTWLPCVEAASGESIYAHPGLVFATPDQTPRLIYANGGEPAIPGPRSVAFW